MAREQIRFLAVTDLAVVKSLTVAGIPVVGLPPAPADAPTEPTPPAGPTTSADGRVMAGGTALVIDSARIATGLGRVLTAVACPNASGAGLTAAVAVAVAWSGSNLDVRIAGVAPGTAVLVNWLALGQ